MFNLELNLFKLQIAELALVTSKSRTRQKGNEISGCSLFLSVVFVLQAVFNKSKPHCTTETRTVLRNYFLPLQFSEWLKCIKARNLPWKQMP